MGESRVLWEIGPAGAEVRELRFRLGLDSGYTTRVLQSLERHGLVTIAPSRADGRVRLARLTRAGRAERLELDRRADRVARGLLEPLGKKNVQKLIDGLQKALE